MAPAPVTEDFYMVLELQQTATTEAITQAYKRLALKHHPDRNKGRDTTAAFQLLVKAYETLKDESKRRAYDHLYPSLRQDHQFPHAPRQPSTTSAAQAQKTDEALQIARLEKSKQDRQAQWQNSKRIIESDLFELRRVFRRLEQEISNLDSIANAEAAEDAWNNSWSAWVLSPIYKQARISDEDKERRDRNRQERRIEKDMKERRLETTKSELKRHELGLEKGQNEIDRLNGVDDRKIWSLRADVRDREERARAAKIRAQREEMERVRKREQEEREKRQREVEEELRRQEQAARKQRFDEAEKRRRQDYTRRKEEETAAQLRRQEAQARTNSAHTRPNDVFGDDIYFSAAGLCGHGGWWAKVQGRTSCPKCSDTWNYLLECPGCKMKACPKCQSTIRPRRRPGASRFMY